MFLFPRFSLYALVRVRISFMLVELFFTSLGLLLFLLGARFLALAGRFSWYDRARVSFDNFLLQLVRVSMRFGTRIKHHILWALLVCVHRVTVFSLRMLSMLENAFLRVSRKVQGSRHVRTHTVGSITPLFEALGRKDRRKEEMPKL